MSTCTLAVVSESMRVSESSIRTKLGMLITGQFSVETALSVSTHTSIAGTVGCVYPSACLFLYTCIMLALPFWLQQSLLSFSCRGNATVCCRGNNTLQFAFEFYGYTKQL